MTILRPRARDGAACGRSSLVFQDRDYRDLGSFASRS